jgi:hypothetical protein
VTILLASSVRMLAFIEMKHSRPPDLKSSSNVILPFAWITGLRKQTQLGENLLKHRLINQGCLNWGEGGGGSRRPLSTPQYFGRSVNTMPTKGGRFCTPLTTGTPKFFTFRHHCKRTLLMFIGTKL